MRRKFNDYGITISRKKGGKLTNKLNTFVGETGTHKSLMLTLITTYGIKPNKYNDIVQSEIVLDDLFAP